MKTRILLLPCIAVITLLCGHLSVSAQNLQVPVEMQRAYYIDPIRDAPYHVLSPEFNPDNRTDGKTKATIDVSRVLLDKFLFPVTHVSYFKPKAKVGGLNRLSSFLKKNRTPKVVVRVAERLSDAKFVESIELTLSEFGWNVVDHNMAAGLKSPKDIKKHTGADVIVDVSWLRFSDPDMFTHIDSTSISIGRFIENVHIMNPCAYIAYKNEKTFEKWKKSQNPKLQKKFAFGYSCEADFSIYRNAIVKEMAKHSCFNTNKNVISAIFKLIDCSDGSIIGTLHIGDNTNDTYKLKEETGLSSNMRHIREKSFYKGLTEEIDDYLLMFLTYLDEFLPNKEIPFAAQLNEMEDVKLSDETIQETVSSRHTSSSQYSGHSRSNYNAYFNSNYYSGYGRGYTSGQSSSSAESSNKSTTTFKEAEYIRYSDFFGYYKPLTERFLEEIRIIMSE